MYVSPLVDARGDQTGWVTSMTNITEAKRIRDQLTASHERFTTGARGPRRRGFGALGAAPGAAVCQPLVPPLVRRRFEGSRVARWRRRRPAVRGDADEAVDVLGGLPTQELTGAGSDSREVFVDSLGKWFGRPRPLPAVDRRPPGPDADRHRHHERRSAEAVAASQAEKAQVTSRLVDHGEMASSVAHELKQPLTAISNYCNGMVTRVQNDAIEKADLIAALKKTSRQAERAVQIILASAPS
jgi:signal transduction histidine kinase